MIRYNHQKIEKKWQKKWAKDKLYSVKDEVKNRQNFYELVMFPYPSGNLHIGHWYNFAPADVVARMKRMQGKNVLLPIGFDAFGLPAENAAIGRKVHPEKWTLQNIKNMRTQLQSMGTMFDWSREVITCQPEYYKWTQWLFIELYKAGLVYRDKTLANWCPEDRTILANEQVEDGKCERCGSIVEQKILEQWMIKITDYAEPLLEGLNPSVGGMDWPEKTKLMQKNWIGKSEGAIIKFSISIRQLADQSPIKPEKRQSAEAQKYIEVFTTRPDTIFGVTYLVLAPENPLVDNLTTPNQKKEVEAYRKQTAAKSELERQFLNKEKTGVFTGAYATNPASGEKVPIYISDYVLINYGTGAVMAVPAHDQRDFEFAQKFRLPIKEVVRPEHGLKDENIFKAFENEGTLVDSGQFSGRKSEKAKTEIVEWLAQKGSGNKKTNYRLRDWIVSRQRYWGCPIPMIHCKKCGWQAVLEKDLPVLLPKIKNYLPEGEGKSPLANSEKFVNTKCPKCGGTAKRETDTLDTFMDSAWYFTRYVDSKNKKVFADKKKLDAWLPIDLYIGGAEHATKHLIYARFIGQFLHNEGYLKTKEPILKMRHQGLILGPDGQKMSKSKGNVVDPDEIVKVFGADSTRMHLCFMSEYSLGGPWEAKGILGVNRFLIRVWNFANAFLKNKKLASKNPDKKTLILTNKTIKKVGEDIESLRFNTAISSLMEFMNHLELKETEYSKETLEILTKLLAPFAPHICEEIWCEILKHKKSIHLEEWPKHDEKFLEEDEFDLVIQVNGILRDLVRVPKNITQEQAEKIAILQPKITKYIEGQNIKKAIFVPGRLINLVIN
ncbi:MAG: Leucine-tRNA ligase [Parcubacteria group bacterium GW2011_GWA2_39_18]|nr:MAG: Leucine-tRNA ligase [Parcubacteria group bacterium GW2011_GWA2_39_18]